MLLLTGNVPRVWNYKTDKQQQNIIGPYTIERDHLKIQIENPIPSPLSIDQTVHLVYTLKKGTSTRGGDTLIDNHGHSYQMKRDQRRHSLHWRCKYNKPPYSCKHSLKQIDTTCEIYTTETLRQSPQPHTCSPVTGVEKMIDFVRNVKDQGMKRPHSSSASIIKEVYNK